MKRVTKIVIGTVAILVVLGAIGGIYVFRRAGNPAFRTAVASRQTVVQDVIFTGRVSSQRSAQLAFELSGPIVKLPVSVGDQVKAGQVLAAVDTRSSQLQLEKARADRLSGQENTYLTWQKTEAEATATAAQNKAKIEKAKQAVRDAKKELDQSQLIWDRTVRESGDEVSTTDTKYLAVISARAAYNSTQKTLTEAQAGAEATNVTARQAADIALANYIATSQSAQGSSGPSVLQSLENIARLSLSKDVLVAPFAGVVTAKNLEVGELAKAGEVVVAVETIDQTEFTADVPETDSVKLSTDMSASITFDAYTAKEAVAAQVVRIAPAAKAIEGVPTFEIVLQALRPDEQLKPGLTANVTVHAAQAEDVIAIPRRAIIRVGNRQYVKVLEDTGEVREQDITAGLIGSDGSAEVTSGLSGGETIIISS